MTKLLEASLRIPIFSVIFTLLINSFLKLARINPSQPFMMSSCTRKLTNRVESDHLCMKAKHFIEYRCPSNEIRRRRAVMTCDIYTPHSALLVFSVEILDFLYPPPPNISFIFCLFGSAIALRSFKRNTLQFSNSLSAF